MVRRIMEITSSAISFIKEHEGVRFAPYKDVAGYWTIGVGHLIKAGERFTRITSLQVDALLRQDLQIAADAVRRHVRVALTENQFTALLSFTFNLGEGNLSRSTLLRLLNAGDYTRAADEFLRWDKAGGRVVVGLSRRRRAERALFLKPDAAGGGAGSSGGNIAAVVGLFVALLLLTRL